MPKTALLIMDLQNSIVSLVTHIMPPNYLQTISSTIATARSHSIPILHITVKFRPGAPEINPRNFSFGRNPTVTGLLENDPNSSIHPSIALEPSDIVIVKKRISAFTGSDLEVVLRSLGVQEIVLCGVATSGVVLSTVREAADKDYGIVVLRDGCLDGDEEVHRVLMEKVFVKQARVLGVGEWVAGLGEGKGVQE
jgi:nicotinamidase-related amidase